MKQCWQLQELPSSGSRVRTGLKRRSRNSSEGIHRKEFARTTKPTKAGDRMKEDEDQNKGGGVKRERVNNVRK